MHKVTNWSNTIKDSAKAHFTRPVYGFGRIKFLALLRLERGQINQAKALSKEHVSVRFTDQIRLGFR